MSEIIPSFLSCLFNELVNLFHRTLSDELLVRYFIAKEHGFNLEFKCQNFLLEFYKCSCILGQREGGTFSLPPSYVCKLKILNNNNNNFWLPLNI